MTQKMQYSSTNEILKNPIILRYTTNRPNIYYRLLSYPPPSLTTEPDGSKKENWSKVAALIIHETNDTPALVYLSFATR